MCNGTAPFLGKYSLKSKPCSSAALTAWKSLGELVSMWVLDFFPEFYSDFNNLFKWFWSVRLGAIVLEEWNQQDSLPVGRGEPVCIQGSQLDQGQEMGACGRSSSNFH